MEQHEVPEIDCLDNDHINMVTGNKNDTSSGTSNVSRLKSIAEKAETIRIGLLGNERSKGKAITPNGEIHVADGLDTCLTGFEINAGDNTWGEWVQILGSSDTPITVGMSKFAIHRIQTIENQRGQDYYWQLAFGESGAAGKAAGEWLEDVLPFKIVNEARVFNVKNQPYAVGTKVWARCRCPGQTSGTMKFYFSLTEFPI